MLKHSVTLLVLVAATWSATFACSCMPQHPQTSYCNSDFAIVGRVQRFLKAKSERDFYDAYKIKIKNTFKASPKAQIALKSGRLVTPASDALCQIKLQPRETYLITGRIVQLKAHINLCNYITPWRLVTPRLRKGFRLLFKQGCACKVHISFDNHWRRRNVSPNTCISGFGDCYEQHGICLRSFNGRCSWARSPSLTQCLRVTNSTVYH